MSHHQIAWLISIFFLCLVPCALLFGAELWRVGAVLLAEFAIVLFIARGSRIDEVKA